MVSRKAAAAAARMRTLTVMMELFSICPAVSRTTVIYFAATMHSTLQDDLTLDDMTLLVA
ncbi:hypothetical protein PF005_g13159 [Phytophthora fragariae]|uniref:Uncharacterized protein n=1 Tax=Phytophthora fragariae TaxID=53985 RepID=A0A6A3KDJ3_9STRA|nr:hypothetical protein PF003_g10622 [Phytophthora fragariae]KAE8936481.1 hypothetical protein PF009_g13597 [Phytophthora fragariae]KAE9005476.1 hypothetical protein PF011_g12023 [Phytophthora fragariae]KAE9084799.1 hypothetical protein PF007_g21382 [Phytophthora fragariae]KAE9106258.1 hypothetical protein PF010_g12687 [Phytophthora fragariae]